MTKLIRPLALAAALLLAPAALPAFAQEQPVGEGGESEGMGPVPGFIATGMFAGLGIFILCKSARRT